MAPRQGPPEYPARPVDPYDHELDDNPPLSTGELGRQEQESEDDLGEWPNRSSETWDSSPDPDAPEVFFEDEILVEDDEEVAEAGGGTPGGTHPPAGGGGGQPPHHNHHANGHDSHGHHHSPVQDTLTNIWGAFGVFLAWGWVAIKGTVSTIGKALNLKGGGGHAKKDHGHDDHGKKGHDDHGHGAKAGAHH